MCSILRCIENVRARWASGSVLTILQHAPARKEKMSNGDVRKGVQERLKNSEITAARCGVAAICYAETKCTSPRQRLFLRRRLRFFPHRFRLSAGDDLTDFFGST